MNLKTKFNIGDNVWVMVRKTPFNSRISGLKVVAKEINVLGHDMAVESKVSIKIKYLVANRWLDENSIACSEAELKLNKI